MSRIWPTERPWRAWSTPTPATETAVPRIVRGRGSVTPAGHDVGVSRVTTSQRGDTTMPTIADLAPQPVQFGPAPKERPDGFTIDCDDCAHQHTSTCDDCV